MERPWPEPDPAIPAVPGFSVNVEGQTLVGHLDSLADVSPHTFLA
ncbi:MAG TPA: hypothetical protein VNE19_03300 [Methylomirabilota bacterium]|nr:hypothetical protein [Methylomirabilota bacterium]